MLPRLDLLNSNAFQVTWVSRVSRAEIDTCPKGIGVDVQPVNATTEASIARDFVGIAPSLDVCRSMVLRAALTSCCRDKSCEYCASEAAFELHDKSAWAGGLPDAGM